MKRSSVWAGRQAGAKLLSVDLDEAERANLAEGIAKLAMERERADHFEKFTQWLDANGPVDMFVDGANVGMYNQNFEESEFSFSQACPHARRARRVCAPPSAGRCLPSVAAQRIRCRLPPGRRGAVPASRAKALAGRGVARGRWWAPSSR
jgi:hypothetical protein